MVAPQWVQRRNLLGFFGLIDVIVIFQHEWKRRHRKLRLWSQMYYEKHLLLICQNASKRYQLTLYSLIPFDSDQPDTIHDF